MNSQYTGVLYQPVPIRVHRPLLLTSEIPPLPRGRPGIFQRHPFPDEYQAGQARPRSSTPVGSALAKQNPVPQPDVTFTTQQTHLVAELTRESYTAEYVFAMYNRLFPDHPKQLQQIIELQTKMLNKWMKQSTNSDQDLVDVQQVTKQGKKTEVRLKLTDAKENSEALHKLHAKLEDDKEDKVTASVEHDKNEFKDEHKEPSSDEELEYLPLSKPTADELSQKRIWNPRKRNSDEEDPEEDNPPSKRSSQSDSPWTRSIKEKEMTSRRIAKEQLLLRLRNR